MERFVSTCNTFQQVYLLITLALRIAAADQHEQIKEVAAQAKDRSCEHNSAIDLFGVQDAADGLAQ